MCSTCAAVKRPAVHTIYANLTFLMLTLLVCVCGQGSALLFCAASACFGIQTVNFSSLVELSLCIFLVSIDIIATSYWNSMCHVSFNSTARQVSTEVRTRQIFTGWRFNVAAMTVIN